MPDHANHASWMSRALDLARRGAGFVSPNPMVGAVIVSREGELLGEGWHGVYGGPHAEVWAVRDAKRRGHGARLREATLYVTLEPCSHHGKTPPCADLIVDEGIPRVVAAMTDPHPRVAGRGFERLRAAGIEVELGIEEHEAQRLNEAFSRHVLTGRPLVTLKIAQTLDGRVATRTGDSRWVTGLQSRTLTHRWRAECDAVMVGSGTARKDDPQLTIRHTWPGRPIDDQRQPVRIVLDREGSLAPSLTVFTDEHASRTIAVNRPGTRPAYAADLKRRGGRTIEVAEREGHLDLRELLDRLGAGAAASRPVQSVLVEAGPGLATALLAQDMVDRLYVFVAPKVIGSGIEGVGDLGIKLMASALDFAEHDWQATGEDLLLRGFLRKV